MKQIHSVWNNYRPENQKQTVRCYQSTYMRLQLKNVELAQRSEQMEFSIYGREVDELVEGLT